MGVEGPDTLEGWKVTQSIAESAKFEGGKT